MPKSRRGATSAAVETESASIVAARSIPLGGELSPWSHGIDPKLDGHARGSRELVRKNFMAARIDARPIFAAAASLAAAIYLAHAYRQRRRHLARCEKYSLDPRYGFLPATCAATLPPAFASSRAWRRCCRRSTARAAWRPPSAASIRSRNRKSTRSPSARCVGCTCCCRPSRTRTSTAPWFRGSFNLDLDEVEFHAGAASTNAEPATELPRVISAPWLHACERLGLPPVYVATGMDLWNHTLELPTAPWFWPSPRRCSTPSGCGSRRRAAPPRSPSTPCPLRSKCSSRICCPRSSTRRPTSRAAAGARSPRSAARLRRRCGAAYRCSSRWRRASTPPNSTTCTARCSAAGTRAGWC